MSFDLDSSTASISKHRENEHGISRRATSLSEEIYGNDDFHHLYQLTIYLFAFNPESEEKRIDLNLQKVISDLLI